MKEEDAAVAAMKKAAADGAARALLAPMHPKFKVLAIGGAVLAHVVADFFPEVARMLARLDGSQPVEKEVKGERIK